MFQVLTGVGPATASAVLAASDPARFPFMADEAMEAVPGFGKRQYTLKHYLAFSKALARKVRCSIVTHRLLVYSRGPSPAGVPRPPP